MVKKDDEFCTEILNLDCRTFCDYVDKTLVKMAKNPQADIFEAWKLYETKIRYMEKFVCSMNKFKKLNKEQQLILYLYYIKDKQCHEVAQILKKTERTVFKKLEKIKEIWFQSV